MYATVSASSLRSPVHGKESGQNALNELSILYTTKIWHAWAYCINFLDIAQSSSIIADIAETKHYNELSQTLTIRFRGMAGKTSQLVCGLN